MKLDTIPVNEQIKATRIILIGDDGSKVGEFLRDDAISMAEAQGFDLIQVGEEDSAPICKLMDYGKLLYEKKKKQKNSSSQIKVKIKELKFGPNTDIHDMNVRQESARKFIEQGHHVKVSVKFKGREVSHPNIVKDKCISFAENLKDIAEMSQEPKFQGGQMTMMLSRKKAE